VSVPGEIRAVFDATPPLTVGLEEEAMLLDPHTLDLAPVADTTLAAVADGRLKRELPAAQLEVVTAPARSVPEAIAGLTAGRRALAAVACPATAGVHPFAAPLGELSAGERYDLILDQYGDVARSQQVCVLQIHVAAGSADRTLPSTTRCVRTRPSSPRWPPTPHSTPAATLASRPCGR
jgi:carboxylate-amine ligase